MVTATECAKALGIPKQRLYTAYKRGIVSVKRYGSAVMIEDVEQARQELAASHFFERSDVIRRAKQLKAANKRPVK